MVEESRRETDGEVGQLPGRDPVPGRAETRSERAGHVAHPDELAGRQEPLSDGGGGDHRLDVHVSQVADVDDL